MPAAVSKRVLWKGAIAFGLVHIPIALHSAVQNQSIDFDWLDKRSMDPVGYKRINKVTGEEIERADIVKGVKQDDGDYVVLEPEEISAAFPRTTQTVEIEAFVPLDAIPFVYLERPYYVAPINKGAKKGAARKRADKTASKATGKTASTKTTTTVRKTASNRVVAKKASAKKSAVTKTSASKRTSRSRKAA